MNVKAAAAVFALAAGWSAPAISADYTIVMAYLATPGLPQTELMDTLPDRISKATDGRVEIKPTATLISVPQIPTALRDGQIQMAALIPAFLGGSEPVFRLSGLPGIIDNFDQYRAVLDAFWSDDMAAVWSERWNTVILADTALCSQAIITTEPLRTLADFQGKKLRLNDRSAAILIAEVGASTVSIPTGEVIPSLQRKVIDGVGTASCWAVGADFVSSAQYMSNWHFGSVQAMSFGVNKDFWDSLPADLQAILGQEFDAIEAELFAGYEELEGKTQAAWEAQGGVYYDVPAEVRQQLYDTAYAKPVYDEWLTQAAGAGLDGAAYLAKARAVAGAKN